MKTAFVITSILLLMAATTLAQGNGSQVYLDNVEGLVDGNIQVGAGSVTFNLYCMNGDGVNKVRYVSNGFRIYGSDSSVTWDNLYYDLPSDIIFFLPDYNFFMPPEFHGVGADTMGFTASILVGPGIPPGYDGEFFWITVTLTDAPSEGGTFCLDSAWFSPSGVWMWAYGAPGSFAPDWDGPHCWPVIPEPPYGTVYLDKAEGTVDGSIQVGPCPVTFYLDLENSTQAGVFGLSNGWRIYGSDSSVTWAVTGRNAESDIGNNSQTIDYYNNSPYHGVGADTVGIRAFNWPLHMFPPGWHANYFRIRIEVTDTASAGGTICLDSAWIPPEVEWLWYYSSSVGNHAPAWEGPYCFPIHSAGDCCFALTGNVDGDPEDKLDIADLVYLVDYMFNEGSEIACQDEADIDGSGGCEIDIADLVYLVDFMFNSGPPPAACP